MTSQTFPDMQAAVVPERSYGEPTVVKTADAVSTSKPSDSASIVESDAAILTPCRFSDMISDLTTAEKVALLSGTSFTTTAGIPRVGIPQLKVSDSVSGVRGSQSHLEDKGTACFPSTTCLASTWNQRLLYSFGEEVGIQAKLKTVQVVLGPNINLHRDPRGGRNFETFSEDPLLTGKLAAAIVNGMQSTGVGACAKHFVGNESETKRRKYNVSTPASSRTMRELYMKAFQYMLRESSPVSIMMAYNQIDGSYCSQTPLIQDVLRKSWQYEGCIMSDWYGTCAGAEALRAGLDLEMPGPSVFRGEKLLAELEAGLVTSEDIDRAARSVLHMIDRTAPSHSSEPETTVICERTSAMARQSAAEGIVLLKNEHNVLPLGLTTAPKIALIGQAAETPSISGGGSACAQPQYVKSVLDCLKAEHPLPASVQYVRGVNPHHCVPSLPVELLRSRNGDAGVDVDYFNDDSPDPVYSERLEAPQIVMLGRLKPGLKQQNFHYVVSTTLTVAEDGRYKLGAQVTGDFTLEIGSSSVLDGRAPDISVEDFLFVPKKLERTAEVDLEAGKAYQLRLTVQARPPMGNGEPTPQAAKLVMQKVRDDRQSIAEAVNVAAQSDVSIIFAGRSHEHESEGFDLTGLELEPAQVRLIKAVSAVSERTILILHHGNPIDVTPVVNDVDAVLAAHFPGQEGASALTDILIGRTNPSGRLATTWPMRLDSECVPSFSNFPCTDDLEISYSEGLQVGYRHPSAVTSSRFPFGHGLGYSAFVISDLKVRPDSILAHNLHIDRSVTATVVVHNTGSQAGHQVVQLYVEPQRLEESGTGEHSTTRPWRPHRELVAFAKPYLNPGETQVVTMTFLEKDTTSTWDEAVGAWRSWPGTYSFVVADNAVVQESCRFNVELGNAMWTGL